MTNENRNSIQRVSYLFVPLLITINPILSFYVNNLSELSIRFLQKPILYSSFSAISLTLFALIVTKQKQKSALISSLILFVFFSYGHMSKFLNDKLFITLPNGMVLGPDKIVIPLLAILIPFLIYKTVKSKNDFNLTMKYITFSLTILTLFLTFQIVLDERNTKKAETSTQLENEVEQISNTPDIYYIILDGYARSDVLSNVYEYDNSKFIQNLRKMGFFVADNANSNYVQTFLSLTSTLNMTYLDSLPKQYGKDPQNKDAAISMLQNNLVSQKLKVKGYKTISFASGWEGTDENYSADVIYNEKRILKVMGLGIVTNETNMVFLQTTMLSPFIKEVWGDQLRGKMLSIFEKLPDVAYMDGKKFVFAHILAPHPPYVFKADGSAVKNPKLDMLGDVFEDKEGYIDQLSYVTNQIQPVLQKILANSKNPPIIILQSDHGPASILGHPFNWIEPYNPEGLIERSAILYAIYFPDKNYEKLSSETTPVNTYGIIFNKYFDENAVTLPNKVYFSNYEEIYKFSDVTNLVQ
jgi:hypothetical protein